MRRPLDRLVSAAIPIASNPRDEGSGTTDETLMLDGSPATHISPVISSTPLIDGVPSNVPTLEVFAVNGPMDVCRDE